MPTAAETAAEKVRRVFGSEVEVRSLHQEKTVEDFESDAVDTLARLCYYYPQYTLEDADKLTNEQVSLLLLQADKQKAIEYYNMALIVAGPHTKNGKLVEKLIKQYRSIAE